jgi:hypothetical protein
VRDADAIVAGLDDHRVRWMQEVLIDRIRERTPNHTVKPYGRRFNAVTGMKRTLRPTLRLDGEPIGGVDIRGTQPALLAAMIEPAGTILQSAAKCIQAAAPAAPAASLSGRFDESDSGGSRTACPSVVDLLSACRLPSAPSIGSDFDRFRESVLGGSLYDELVSVCEAKGVRLDAPPKSRRKKRRRRAGETPRDRVKTLVLQDVLAQKQRYFSDLDRVFAELFRSDRPIMGRLVRAAACQEPNERRRSWMWRLSILAASRTRFQAFLGSTTWPTTPGAGKTHGEAKLSEDIANLPP